MMTDSEQFSDTITRGKRTAERRLAIDIPAARDAYKSFEITSIGLVAGDVNSAEALSKVMVNDAVSRVMSEWDRTSVIGWIVRKNADFEDGSQCETE